MFWNDACSYDLRLNYESVVDILEEFAFLDTTEGGNVNLDILPVSAKQVAQLVFLLTCHIFVLFLKALTFAC